MINNILHISLFEIFHNKNLEKLLLLLSKSLSDHPWPALCSDPHLLMGDDHAAGFSDFLWPRFPGRPLQVATWLFSHELSSPSSLFATCHKEPELFRLTFKVLSLHAPQPCPHQSWGCFSDQLRVFPTAPLPAGPMLPEPSSSSTWAGQVPSLAFLPTPPLSLALEVWTVNIQKEYTLAAWRQI